MIFTSLFASIVPISFYLYFIWRLDKNEPEPIKFVLLHFFYGATGAVILGLLGSAIVTFPIDIVYHSSSTGIYKTVIVAPIVEEFAKAFLLFRTIRDKRVDNLTDGLVYGGSIGLGFGMTENFLYYLAFGNNMETLLPLILVRTLFSVVMHTIATASVGAFMVRSKFSNSKTFLVSSAVGLLIAISIHFFWNLSVSFDNTNIFGIILMIVIVAVFLSTFNHSLKQENKIIFEKLKGEIPSELLSIVSTSKKFKKNWFINNKRKRFLKLTIRLAFRKYEVEISETIDELYIKEIDDLREEIATLVSLYNSNQK